MIRYDTVEFVWVWCEALADVDGVRFLGYFVLMQCYNAEMSITLVMCVGGLTLFLKDFMTKKDGQLKCVSRWPLRLEQ